MGGSGVAERMIQAGEWQNGSGWKGKVCQHVIGKKGGIKGGNAKRGVGARGGNEKTSKSRRSRLPLFLGVHGKGEGDHGVPRSREGKKTKEIAANIFWSKQGGNGKKFQSGLGKKTAQKTIKGRVEV